jgi:hypothetical protein
VGAQVEPLPPEEDEQLVAEADRLELQGADRETYFRSTPRQRNLTKGQRHRSFKAEARRLGLDPEAFVVMTADERREARERSEADKQARIQAMVEKHGSPKDDQTPAPEPPRVHHTGDEVPATDPNLDRREAPTVGPIEDLVGDRPPRTLADVYARWPLFGMTGGEDFYLRVERSFPKKWGGIDVGGYLGEIREVRCNEEQFGRFFGKGEYNLQLYGPDPKGRRDAEGNRIIKALTEVFTITIPDKYGPPRLVPVPTKPKKHQEDTMFGGNPMNPFGTPGFPAIPTPTTQADAAVHKTSLDFAAQMMGQRQRDLEEREKQIRTQDGGAGTPPRHVFDFMGQTTKATLEQARADADARERILRHQLDRSEKEREKLRGEMDRLEQKIEEARGRDRGDALEIAKLRDGDAQRLHEHYRNQMDNAQRSHDDQMRSLKEAHEAEIKRERDRITEQQTYYDRQLAEERRRAQDHEKELKDELDRVRREEREQADKRVAEAEKRADERLKDQETSHQRELRTMKETFESRVDSTRTKLEFELSHTRERLEDARQDAQKARDEADKAKDPVTAVKEFEEKAKQLGLEKPDPHEPKTVWDRFAAAAGTGVGQALAHTDLSSLVGALRGAVVPPGRPGPQQVPPGQQPQQLPPAQRPQQQRRGPSSRAMQWAAQGAQIPSPAPQPQPVQVQSQEPPAAAQPVQPAQAEPGPQGAPAPQAPTATNGSSQPQQQAQPAQPPQQPRQQVVLPEHPLRQAFGDEAVVQFIGNAEQAINANMPPQDFATMFYGQFPEHAVKLATEFSPDDAVDFVQKIPVAAGSPVLRRDGKKWLEKLWESMRAKAQPSAPEAQPTA